MNRQHINGEKNKKSRNRSTYIEEVGITKVAFQISGEKTDYSINSIGTTG